MTPEESAAQNKRVLKVGNEPEVPEKKLDLNVEEDREEAIKKSKAELLKLKGKEMSAKIMWVRRQAAQIIKMARRSHYFQENNHGPAIAAMMCSGLGRIGRRKLQKKLMMPWRDYRAIEEVLIVNGEYEISFECAKGLGYKTAWYESQGWTHIKDMSTFSAKTKYEIMTHYDKKVTHVLVRKEKRNHSKLKKNLFISPTHVFEENQICMVRKSK